MTWTLNWSNSPTFMWYITYCNSWYNYYTKLHTICREGCRSHLRNHKSQTFVHFIFLLLLQTWHHLEDMGKGGKIIFRINIITTAAIILAITITSTRSSSRTERLALSSPSTGWQGWTMIPKSHWFWRQSIWQTDVSLHNGWMDNLNSICKFLYLYLQESIVQHGWVGIVFVFVFGTARRVCIFQLGWMGDGYK